MDYLDLAAKELAEIAKQEKALNERKAKLRAFSEMGASLFGTQPSISLPAQTHLQLADRQLAVAAIPKKREGTIKARIEQIASDLLLPPNLYVQTADVLREAEAQGVQIGAENKLQAVSVILNRAGTFKSHRSKGWYINYEKADTAPTVSASSAANAA